MRNDQEIKDMVNELENAVSVDDVEEYDRVAKDKILSIYAMF